MSKNGVITYNVIHIWLIGCPDSYREVDWVVKKAFPLLVDIGSLRRTWLDFKMENLIVPVN